MLLLKNCPTRAAVKKLWQGLSWHKRLFVANVRRNWNVSPLIFCSLFTLFSFETVLSFFLSCCVLLGLNDTNFKMDHVYDCTGKTKCRNFYTNIHRKGMSGPQSQFPHSCVCERIIQYIPTMGLPFLLEEICGPILGIYKSLTDTWMWILGLRPRYSQKRNV